MLSMCSSLYFSTAASSTSFLRNPRQGSSQTIFGQMAGSNSLTTRNFSWSSRLMTAALISSNVMVLPPFYIMLSCFKPGGSVSGPSRAAGQSLSLPWRLNNALGLQRLQLFRSQPEFEAVNISVVPAHRTAEPFEAGRRFCHLPGLVGHGQFAVIRVSELFKGTPHPPVFGLHGFHGRRHSARHHDAFGDILVVVHDRVVNFVISAGRGPLFDLFVHDLHVFHVQPVEYGGKLLP